MSVLFSLPQLKHWDQTLSKLHRASLTVSHCKILINVCQHCSTSTSTLFSLLLVQLEKVQQEGQDVIHVLLKKNENLL